MRPQDRERIQVEVVARVTERLLAAARASTPDRDGIRPEGAVEAVVSDTLYHERRRLDHAELGPRRQR